MKLKYLALLLFIVAVSEPVVAQRGGYRSAMQDYYLANSVNDKRFLQRMAVSVGLQMISGKADIAFNGFADSGGYRADSFKADIKAKQSFVVHIGSYFPLLIVSDNSMLVFNMELMASVSKLTYDSITITPGAKFSIPFQTYRAGMPLSIEYRMGGDARLNKNYKTCFGIGAGINPGILYSTDYNRNPPLKITPFVKAEAGFFAGLAFKLRVIAYFGETEYDYSENYNKVRGLNNLVRTEIRGNYGYSASLVIMPFSYMWSK